MEPSRIRHDLLRQRDQEVNPNVAQLCRELDMPRTTYYDVISGRSGARMKNLEKICQMLGLTLHDVIILDAVAV